MIQALSIAGALVIVGLVPGFFLFRLPVASREKRAALAAEERAYWYVLISVAWSVSISFALAAASLYRFDRLILINLGVATFIALLYRARLRFEPAAVRPTAGVLLPLILLALCCWRFLPASEYVIGGKDPGAYVNDGISIARTGTLFRHDAIVAAVPEQTRDLFFPDYAPTEYWGVRFMGVFLNDPATGEVVLQFPHLFPVSIAIGYGVGGIYGATTTVAGWAILGVLAVYFLGVRLVGRWASFLACLLLAVHVIETWNARYPNAEVVMQTLLFAGLLAFAKGEDEDDHFFSWFAGLTFALLVFLRFDSFLAVAAVSMASALTWITKRRAPSLGLVVPLVVGIPLAFLYYSGPMRGFFWQYRVNLPGPTSALLLVAGGLLAVLALGSMRKTLAPVLTKYLPMTAAAVLVALAAYALFFREPGGRLLPADAYALRTFRDAYVFWPALLVALIGFAVVGRSGFWRDPAFFIMFAVFCVFFFRKIHVVHEHFWLARRFLPVILPGMFLLAAGAAVGASARGQKYKLGRRIAGTALILFIGWQYRAAAAPVAAHVEYRGAIHSLDQIAGRIGDRDLLIVESRGSSDLHVLAMPLAYAYDRNVLVLDSELPDRRAFETFLTTALKRYARVLVLANGGTDLLSQRVSATPVASGQMLLPEYATAPWDSYPTGPRQKDLSYNLYQLTLGETPRRGFTLDVGTLDDLSIVRFHAHETTDGRSVRWTMKRSFIAATGLTGSERQLTIEMHDGGRPAAAPAAAVEVFFNGTSLGRLNVEKGFKRYTLALPPELVARAVQSGDPAQIRLESTTWRPRDVLGGTDDRELGVMVDRVEIH